MTIQKRAQRALLLTWFAYLLFVLFTDWADFGLTVQPDKLLRWLSIRVLTVTAWLTCGWMLLALRHPPENWSSFLSGAGVSAFAGILALSSVVPDGSNYFVLLGSLLFYSLVSGFLCITARKTLVAGILGLILFPLQFCIDGVAHVLSGVFRLH